MKSNSPINQESTEAQNIRLMAHLKSGKTINYQEARERHGIPYLNSRVADCNKPDKVIDSKYIKIGRTTCKEYFLKMSSK